MSLIGRVYYKLQRTGLGFSDWWAELSGRIFDIVHGVDTSGQIAASELDVPALLKSHAVKYQPTKIKTFLKAMSHLRIQEPEKFAFIDFGCGKGRCLLLAVPFGFGQILGVELSPSLAAIARKNADAFKRVGVRSLIEIQNCPSSEANLPEQPSVYFFYNPFDQQIMRETFESIDKITSERMFEAYVVYINPQHQQTLRENGFSLLHSGKTGGEEWTIWKCRKFSVDSRKAGTSRAQE